MLASVTAGARRHIHTYCRTDTASCVQVQQQDRHSARADQPCRQRALLASCWQETALTTSRTMRQLTRLTLRVELGTIMTVTWLMALMRLKRISGTRRQGQELMQVPALAGRLVLVSECCAF